MPIPNKRKRSLLIKTDDRRPGKVPMEKNKCSFSDDSFTENESLKGHIATVHEKNKHT